jgi:hypothetical protein
MAIQKISGVTIELTSQASGDVAYFDGTDWVRLAKGEAGKVLTMNESETAPEWATVWTFPGTVKGYCAAGNRNNNGVGAGPPAIERWSFTTDGNSTDVGDVTLGRHHSSGQSSGTDGYISGSAANGPVTLAIDRWSFASEGNAVDHGDLAIQSGQGTGQSSETHGYHTGGGISGSAGTNHIQKFAFATSGTNNATDIADLLVARNPTAGSSSSTHGYSAGGITGLPPGGGLTTIDKFAYATDINATDVGDCDTETSSAAGTSSLTHGYIVGGTTENIRKYSFASDGDSVDGSADLSDSRHALTGCSSETFGYAAAGFNTGAYPPGQPNGATETIEKFSVATDSNATDVGDLAIWKWYATPVGSQV